MSNQIALCALLAASAAYSAYNIATVSIWYDEAITLLTLSGHALPDWNGDQFIGFASFFEIVSDLNRYDVHPPAYFLLASIWRRIFGTSLEAVRAMSSIFIILSLWTVYAIARGFSIRYPLLPVAIFAASGAAVAYAYTARSYAMATFLILITALLVQRRNQMAGVIAAVAVWTHYFSALAVAPLLICFFLKDRKRSTASIVLFVGLVAPLAPSAYRHMHARPAQYSQSATLSSEIFAVAAGPLNAGFPRSSAGLLRRAALSIAATCVAAGCFIAIRQGAAMPVLTILGFLAGFSMLAIVSGKSVSAMPSGYYFGPLAPFLALTIGFSVSRKWSAMAITSLLLLSAVRHLNIVPNSTYRERISAITQRCKDTCVIVVGAGYGRGVPGSVMYESQRFGIPVVILGKGPIPQHKYVHFIPSGEPPTAEAERLFATSIAFLP